MRAAQEHDGAAVSLSRSHLNSVDGKTKFVYPKNCRGGEESVFYFAKDRVGTWGFAPVPEVWLSFLIWCAKREKAASARSSSPGNMFVDDPTMPHLALSRWYEQAEALGKTSSIWSMHFLKYWSKFPLLLESCTCTTRAARHLSRAGERTASTTQVSGSSTRHF